MTPEIENAVYPTNSSTPSVSMMMMNTSSSSNALFGKYEVGRLLGCGAFAKVYHARNVLTGQSVAIKMINKKKVTGTALASNIKREISIMRRLRHPNIVKLHEVMATRSKIYFVMELVKGGELFSRVAKGRFSEDLSRKYFQQLISAIGYCHSRGVYHRDLKPENLLVDENGDLKVSDFGLSAIKDRNCQQQQQLLLQTLCGTPAYVAPEILTKRGYDGSKVDIWSCGIILFVLNAGYLPFNDPNLMNMYKKIYKGEFRCPKWFSSDLKRFLSRLLDTNPANRITVDEMIKDPWFVKGGGLKFYREVSFYKYDKYWGSEEDNNNNNNMELTLASSSSSNNTDTNSNLGGGDPLNIQREDGSSNVINSSSSSTMNAFDIISFSSGLDLSGLFDQASNPMQDAERFFSAESPEIIMNRIQTVVENLASSAAAPSSSAAAASSSSSSSSSAAAVADAPPVRDREEKLSTRRVRKKKEVELAGSIDLAGPIGGMSVAKVEIKRLTEQLVVVEVKREAGAGDGLSISSSRYNDIWKMVRSHLDDLVYQQRQVV